MVIVLALTPMAVLFAMTEICCPSVKFRGATDVDKAANGERVGLIGDKPHAAGLAGVNSPDRETTRYDCGSRKPPCLRSPSSVVLTSRMVMVARINRIDMATKSSMRVKPGTRARGTRGDGSTLVHRRMCARCCIVDAFRSLLVISNVVVHVVQIKSAAGRRVLRLRESAEICRVVGLVKTQQAVGSTRDNQGDVIGGPCVECRFIDDGGIRPDRSDRPSRFPADRAPAST